jgi:hypothetical protein
MLKFGLIAAKGIKLSAAHPELRPPSELSLSQLLKINQVIRLPRRITFKSSGAGRKPGFLA